MRNKKHIYEVWKEVVIEMGKAGRFSSETVEHQERVLDFAEMRERWSPIEVSRYGEGGIVRSVRLLYRPLKVLAIAAVLFFGCRAEWYAALALALLAEIALHRLKLILWYVFRSLQVAVYMLARLNAEKEGIDIYEARNRLEYMHHPEIPFEKELLDSDLHGFGYQVSSECLRGKCQKCNGKCSHLRGEKADLPCLHECHRAK